MIKKERIRKILQSNLTSSAKLVYLALVVEDEEGVQLSQKEIANYCHLAIRTVQHHLGCLAKEGWVERVQPNPIEMLPDSYEVLV